MIVAIVYPRLQNFKSLWYLIKSGSCTFNVVLIIYSDTAATMDWNRLSVRNTFRVVMCKKFVILC